MGVKDIYTMNEKQLRALELSLKKSLKELKVGTIGDSKKAQQIWALMYKVQKRKEQLGR